MEKEKSQRKKEKNNLLTPDKNRYKKKQIQIERVWADRVVGVL